MSEQLSCQSENPVCTLIGFQGSLIFAYVTAARNPDVSLLRDHQVNLVFRHHKVHPLPFLVGCV